LDSKTFASGPSLFTWNYGTGTGGDNEILKGNLPFEFRVLTEPKDNLVEERKATFEHLRQFDFVEEEMGKEEGKCVIN
jgi:hypothetical protein